MLKEIQEHFGWIVVELLAGRRVEGVIGEVGPYHVSFVKTWPDGSTSTYTAER